jgi:TRAP-type mannitol/chloroaromatic compound transport system permease large subunit
MSPEHLGLVLLGALLTGIFVGFPIAFTLIILSFVFGYIGFGKLVFYLIRKKPWQPSRYLSLWDTCSSRPA